MRKVRQAGGVLRRSRSREPGVLSRDTRGCASCSHTAWAWFLAVARLSP